MPVEYPCWLDNQDMIWTCSSVLHQIVHRNVSKSTSSSLRYKDSLPAWSFFRQLSFTSSENNRRGDDDDANTWLLITTQQSTQLQYLPNLLIRTWDPKARHKQPRATQALPEPRSERASKIQFFYKAFIITFLFHNTTTTTFFNSSFETSKTFSHSPSQPSKTFFNSSFISNNHRSQVRIRSPIP